MNTFGADKTPFLLLVDFDCKNCLVEPLKNIDFKQLKYWLNGQTNTEILKHNTYLIDIQKNPISFKEYKESFKLVQENILKGNSFLTNLTCETPIDINISFAQIFNSSKAKYKIWLKHDEQEFVCFSPEIFVRINQSGRIDSFPMKGTVDATLPHAEHLLMNDKKELYEHTTIVDLIRNDISKVAKKVWVEKFRFIDRIKKQDGRELLQLSSQISGELGDDWQKNLGSIIFDLLPAGSISGAPKDKTVAIINQAETNNYPFTKNRNFYTGICGIFDGNTFDSGVMIRFIERKNKNIVFKSGGGITSNSVAQKEYEEMIQKIYVPIIRNNSLPK